MEYLIAILVLVVFVAIYVLSYLFNANTKKPDNCKQIDCQGCKINCNKKG